MDKKIVIVLILLVVFYQFSEIAFYRNRELSLETEKLRQPIRISQISDYHDNSLINKKRLLRSIKKFNPDLLLLTGDIVDEKTESMDNIKALIEDLASLGLDTYFVYGNHEYRNRRLEEFERILRDNKIKILYNELEEVRIKGQRVKLLGLDYFLDRQAYENLRDELGHDSYNIVLSHSPNIMIGHKLDREDLVISGHTHGGQVRLPFLGALVAPGQEFLPKVSKGVYSQGPGQLYVDSGLGNSKIALRFLNPVQISHLEIRPKI